MTLKNYLLSSIAILVCAVGSSFISAGSNQDESEFTKPTIDIGCVVSDIDASVKFYTEAIGFEQTSEFKVGAEYANKVGLTDNKPLDVKVLTLGTGAGATQLKLMQVDGESAKAAHDHIHTTLGYSYLTIYVKSTEAAMKRLKDAGVETVAESPLPIEGAEQITLTLIRDPDGNIIELISPSPEK
ncbi:VOC family protein [Mariniblastus fucicola]|uniref:Glyoxalase-like domain protein n=1 Tax=Mariniblastus fucicola TaxID=980251 RepID=A0A5B9PBH0_9BACT|nr:VOC family protein [Mariniblastus fucicola]QEG20473.1 Glyoxalase-like domain protein [Mariniblastus fucicola]